MDEVNGGDFVAELLPLVGGVRARTESSFEILQSPNTHRVFAWFAIIQEIGGRKEAGDTLDRAAVAVHRVFSCGVAVRAFDGHGEREVSTRTAARDTEAIWIHSIFGCVVANEPHRPVNVLLDFSDDEFWLRPVHDGEDGVAAV